MSETVTLNQALQTMKDAGAVCVPIASGYYVGKTRTYFLCKCDGNSHLFAAECDCGTELFVCESCYDRGEITQCSECQGRLNHMVRFMRRQFRESRKKLLGVTDEELDALEKKMLEEEPDKDR